MRGNPGMTDTRLVSATWPLGLTLTDIVTSSGGRSVISIPVTRAYVAPLTNDAGRLRLSHVFLGSTGPASLGFRAAVRSRVAGRPAATPLS